MNGPDTEERLKESLEELDAIREKVRKSIALRRYDTVAKDVAEFTQANELEVVPDSPEYRIVAHELLKANLDMLKVLFHRQQGDYGQEDAIIAKYAVEDAHPVQAAPAVEEEPGITLFELIDKFCEFKIKMGKVDGQERHRAAEKVFRVQVDPRRHSCRQHQRRHGNACSGLPPKTPHATRCSTL